MSVQDGRPAWTAVRMCEMELLVVRAWWCHVSIVLSRVEQCADITRVLRGCGDVRPLAYHVERGETGRIRVGILSSSRSCFVELSPSTCVFFPVAVCLWTSDVVDDRRPSTPRPRTCLVRVVVICPSQSRC